MRRRPASSADEVLIRGLFQEHGAALVAYASRLCGDRRTGDEVVRETLLRAWPLPSPDRAQLFAIVRQVIAERRGTPIDATSVVDSSAVLAAVRTLPPEQREVLLAVFFQGHDVASTASALGVPEATVKARVSFALRRLRDVMGGAPLPAADSPAAEHDRDSPAAGSDRDSSAAGGDRGSPAAGSDRGSPAAGGERDSLAEEATG